MKIKSTFTTGLPDGQDGQHMPSSLKRPHAGPVESQQQRPMPLSTNDGRLLHGRFTRS
ncbi:MAG TPA: hypothetical protein VFF81_15225 [Noviherbaspirillum sp.]|nr:hypothetical protein [Noviherbaspirillum sp.]